MCNLSKEEDGFPLTVTFTPAAAQCPTLRDGSYLGASFENDPVKLVLDIKGSNFESDEVVLRVH